FSGYLKPLQNYPYLLYTTDSPIPAEFALPFGKFIQTYDLQDVAFDIANEFGPSFLDIPVLGFITETGLKELSLDAIHTVSIEGGNSQIYANVLARLGSTYVLFNSTISSFQRDASSSIQLVVDTSAGNRLI
ncbi:unnamed protein product, partial [Penicillium salamii]